jgi:hypothetical protein
MRILIACEYSGIVRDAFADKGHEAWSCDILPTERLGKHYECDVMDVIYQEWDMIIAHPPCTFLANSGVRWLYGEDKERVKQRWVDLTYARKFFDLFYNHLTCKKICVENPIPHKHAMLPKWTQTIQPYEFGHTTQKRTCLWLKNLEPLKPAEIIPKEHRTQDIWRMAPGDERKKERKKQNIPWHSKSNGRSMGLKIKTMANKKIKVGSKVQWVAYGETYKGIVVKVGESGERRIKVRPVALWKGQKVNLTSFKEKNLTVL